MGEYGWHGAPLAKISTSRVIPKRHLGKGMAWGVPLIHEKNHHPELNMRGLLLSKHCCLPSLAYNVSSIVEGAWDHFRSHSRPLI